MAFKDEKENKIESVGNIIGGLLANLLKFDFPL